MVDLIQRVAAKAVIESEGAILALQPSSIDSNKKWHNPGGLRDDINEDIINTASREVLEETGINLGGLPYKVIKIGEWQAVDKGVPVKILGIFFHFTLPSRPRVTLSEEHQSYAWINLSNYQTYDLHPDLKEATEIVFGQPSH